MWTVHPTSSNFPSPEVHFLICFWRYNEKQARIAERRRLNFEKKLAVRSNQDTKFENKSERCSSTGSLLSFTAPAWSNGSLCRRDTNATSRRTALRLFLPKQSWLNTSRLTRRSWRSAWYAPTTHPGEASIIGCWPDVLTFQGRQYVVRSSEAEESSTSTRRSMPSLSRPRPSLGKMCPALTVCFSYSLSGFDLSSCTTRWVCYLTSLRRNTRPWWVSFSSEELSETDIGCVQERMFPSKLLDLLQLMTSSSLYLRRWGLSFYCFLEILNHLFWHLPHFRWIFNICLVAKSS